MTDKPADYTPEERDLYPRYVASGSIPWLSDSLVVSRRSIRVLEKANAFHYERACLLRELLLRFRDAIEDELTKDGFKRRERTWPAL